MSTEWPKSQEETCLDLLQLYINTDNTPPHDRGLDAGRVLSDPSTDARFMAIGGIYNATSPTITDGKMAALRISSNGGLIVDNITATVIGPTEILNSVTNGAGTVTGTVVDTRTASSGQCFSIDASNVVLNAGTITLNLEWSFSAAGPFSPFSGGAINITGNDVVLYQYGFKSPYIRCSKVIGVGVTSCTIIVKHFANGA